MGKELVTEKTRRETGLDHVFASLNILTPYGKKELRSYRPFMPGQEEELRGELGRLEDVRDILSRDASRTGQLKEILMLVKDNSLSLEKSRDTTLSTVEIYEIKILLLQMEKLRKMDEEDHFPGEFVPDDLTKLLDILDPDGGRVSTFFIYDSFSEKLAELRERKKRLEQQTRKLQKTRATEMKKEHGIVLTPKFEIRVNKEDHDRIKMIENIAELEKSAEDYMSITWQLATDGETDQLIREKEECEEQIESEEFTVRRQLTAHIAGHASIIEEGCRRIGMLDLAIAKADHAEKHRCICPEITEEHRVAFEEGRHIQVEEILNRDGSEYCPISIELEDGVSCITGANMGGKTVSLKLSGLIPLMTQYGMFVPCQKATIGLSSSISILIGDSQSIERGLSSFGSEMEELKRMLDESGPRAFLLIDEIAAGTNPSEGLALTKSVIDYLKAREYITLITTHYELGPGEEDINRLQVTGLACADLQRLDTELKTAGPKERIGVIRRHMDYRLRKAQTGDDVPQDALNIARMLGIGSDIIDRAKDYLR
jgi:DNA mismatch repair ATPase MutS